MSGLRIRVEERAGRLTLDRPTALNALTWETCRAIDAALQGWAGEDAVDLVLIDGAGDKAFCAGGDIADMYAAGQRGDFGYGQRFWADEYRMNAAIAAFPKPVVSLMHGFTMGGGVGVGCHASHRVVGATSRLAMPECGIGLVPDTGGSALLARAPGRLGAWLGVTGARMGPGDAILCGFADRFVPEADWPALVARLAETGDADAVATFARPPPAAALADQRAEIDALFALPDLATLSPRLARATGKVATEARAAIARNSPLSMACTLRMLDALGPAPTLRAALAQEYRFTFRSLEHSDFLEGVRAAIIDKDRRPRWRHAGAEAVTAAEVDAMLAALGPDALTFERTGT